MPAFGPFHPFSFISIFKLVQLRLVSVLNAYGSFRYFPTAKFAKYVYFCRIVCKQRTDDEIVSIKIAWRTAFLVWWVKIIMRKRIKNRESDFTSCYSFIITFSMPRNSIKYSFYQFHSLIAKLFVVPFRCSFYTIFWESFMYFYINNQRSSSHKMPAIHSFRFNFEAVIRLECSALNEW